MAITQTLPPQPPPPESLSPTAPLSISGPIPLVLDASSTALMSPSIQKLATALASAQAEITNAEKNKENPYHGSNYADLASVWDACRAPLTRNGLSVTQVISVDDKGRTLLVSILLHISGEWIISRLPINPVKPDPQNVGSAITYMRRFALSALVGVAPVDSPTEQDRDDDDDGNAASGLTDSTSTPPDQAPEKKKTQSQSGKPAKITPKGTQSPPQKAGKLTPASPPTAKQVPRLYAIAAKQGIDGDGVHRLIAEAYKLDSVHSLNQQQYQWLTERIENGNAKKFLDELKAKEQGKAS